MTELLLSINIEAILSALFGGSVVGGILKYLEFRKSKSAQESNFEAKWREEMREDIKDQRKLINELKDDRIEDSKKIIELNKKLSEHELTITYLRNEIKGLIHNLNSYKVESGLDPIDWKDIEQELNRVTKL